MSTDGGSVAEAARGLAARLRAVAVDGRRRSRAMLRSRAAVGDSPRAGQPVAEFTASTSGDERDDADVGDDGIDLAGPTSAGSGPAQPAAPGQQRRRLAAVRALEGTGVPDLLARAAVWSLCVLLVAAVAYLAFEVATALRLLVMPLIAAVLITALLQPLTARLRRLGLRPLAAAWLTVLAATVVLGGVAWLITARVQADYPRLAAETQSTVRQVEAYLAGPPFRLSEARLAQLSNKLLQYLGQHKTFVIGTVVTGGRYFIEGLTGIILTMFIAFFLLKDGSTIWSWLIKGLGDGAQGRANLAGGAAWQALVSYIRGSTIVAAIHAIVIGIALWLIGIPLVVPLAILVFLAAYVPLIGILVVGALAIMVTLATKGVAAALVLLAVFLAENQLESHLLQPLVVGRVVRLHPLAIIMVLAVGGIVAGVPGAIVAVPTAAVVTYSWPYLSGRRGGDAQMQHSGGDAQMQHSGEDAQMKHSGEDAQMQHSEDAP